MQLGQELHTVAFFSTQFLFWPRLCQFCESIDANERFAEWTTALLPKQKSHKKSVFKSFKVHLGSLNKLPVLHCIFSLSFVGNRNNKVQFLKL